ncbi:hypothetical protein L484_018421 [Morus notabilis]|uniref:C2H2-type domain-containing protein n=1 Tax=Morus notabilis TaxID=981085 RepID=W9QD61_9ROSA|nr:hypothetical protein L484_018421 [Morus notabilis]
MALSFNPDSYSSLGLHNQPINGQFYSGVVLGDHTFENVFIGSQQPNRLGLHQSNQFISQLITDGNPTTHQTTFSSQEAHISQRNTCLVPQRIQLVETVNIDYFPSQNQAISSVGPLGGQVCVTEVVRTREIVRTQLINSASTRDRFLVPNNHGYNSWINDQGQTHLQNQANHSTFTETQPFIDAYCPNTITQSSSHCFHNTKYEEFNTHVQESNYIIGDNTSSDPQPLSVYFPHETKRPIPTDNHDFYESRDFPFTEYCSRYNRVFHDQGENNISDQDDDDEDNFMGDGRTHSLPYKKYGPYTCPRCKGVFTTSQTFAAHVGSHYKSESAEERRKRHLAKYGKKHLRLVKSRNEVNIVPYKPHFNEPVALDRHNKKNEVKTIGSEDQESNKSTGKEILVTLSFRGEKFEGLFDVPIKEEPMEMIS